MGMIKGKYWCKCSIYCSLSLSLSLFPLSPSLYIYLIRFYSISSQRSLITLQSFQHNVSNSGLSVFSLYLCSPCMSFSISLPPSLRHILFRFGCTSTINQIRMCVCVCDLKLRFQSPLRNVTRFIAWWNLSFEAILPVLMETLCEGNKYGMTEEKEGSEWMDQGYTKHRLNGTSIGKHSDSINIHNLNR